MQDIQRGRGKEGIEDMTDKDTIPLSWTCVPCEATMIALYVNQLENMIANHKRSARHRKMVKGESNLAT